MAIGAIDLELRAHRESDAIGCRAERLDVRLGPRLLRAKLVAGKTDDREVLAREIFVQPFEIAVLRREAASARHVHREHDLSAQRAEEIGPSVDAGDVEVEERRHGCRLRQLRPDDSRARVAVRPRDPQGLRDVPGAPAVSLQSRSRQPRREASE
jgi:hypothetical protein